jgi:hypothetical protein
VSASVDPSEASKQSRKVLTFFKLPQESPLRKSTLPLPTQRQGYLNAAACPFMSPGLCSIDLGMTKEPLLHVESPVSKGTQDSKDDEAREEDTDRVEALTALQTEHDALLEQQTHWEDLRHATETLDHLPALVTRF